MVMRIPERPIIYEINTAVFLNELSQRYNRRITLANVPKAEWDEIKKMHVDAVWLMGVWQRSPIGKQMAWQVPEYRELLPDLEPDDVMGSAYCIYDYVVDRNFGGDEALAYARKDLYDRGLALILDFVPNHVALDHPWTASNIEFFVQGSDNEAEHHPEAFYKSARGVIAKGKDPHYAPWSDVAQLNAFSEGYRRAAAETLNKIGGQCDGVRCDMAMLMCNGVFHKTWGGRAGDVPETEFWPTVISSVRAAHPDFTLIAEAYWGMQKDLFEQGFDYCYDKDVYDLLAAGQAADIYNHLRSTEQYQKNLVRFMENHDEERAASIMQAEQNRAAAVLLATIEGARLFLDGQFEGYPIRIPVQLARGPIHKPDAETQAFYESLMLVVNDMQLSEAKWELLTSRAGHLKRVSKDVLAWRWLTPSGNYYCFINYSPNEAAAKVSAKFDQPANLKGALVNGAKFEEKITAGQKELKIRLQPWGYALLKTEKSFGEGSSGNKS